MNKLTENTKTSKADKFGYKNLILHLSPMKKAMQGWDNPEFKRLAEKRIGRKLTVVDKAVMRGLTACQWAGACAKFCLDTAGRGKFSNVQLARMAKTAHNFIDGWGFQNELIREIKGIRAKNLAIRLNGTSDLDFMEVYKLCSDIQFYDYTKGRARFKAFMAGELPKNYYLTYSYDRKNDYDTSFLFGVVSNGGKVAIMKGDYEKLIVNEKNDERFLAFTSAPLIDGDEHDLRFFDKKVKQGGFVVLNEKGDAKNV